MIAKKAISIASRDRDEVELFFAENYVPASVRPHHAQRVIGRHGHVLQFKNIMFECSTTIGGYDITPNVELDAIIFHCNSSGGLRVDKNSSSIYVSPGEIGSWFGGDVKSVSDQSGSRHSTVCIQRQFAARRLSELCDGKMGPPLMFRPLVPGSGREASTFSKIVRTITEGQFLDVSELPPVLETSFANFVFDAALQLLPNNYSEQLNVPPPTVAPRHTKIALDYIHAHIREMPSPDELARIAGVSVRSLQYSFRNFVGSTISDYQRRLRLQSIKDEIVNNSHDTIEVIAKRWGFTNMGRFVSEFRKLFGQLPSQVRKNRNFVNIGSLPPRGTDDPS